jgi:hypothetical protein
MRSARPQTITRDMQLLSDAAAVRLLFARSHASLETEAGEAVPVQAVSVGEGRAVVTAPRLRVTCATRLTGRVLAEDGSPWEVEMRVAGAEYASRDLAKAELVVERVRRDATRRRTPRVPVGGIAWLEALECQNVVDRDRVDGSMVDLSLTGVAFATARSLRRGDRLRFHGRFFADVIEAEVQVQSVRPGPIPGRSIVGCAFSEQTLELETRIRRILAPKGEPARVDVAGLRGALPPADRGPGWRRVLRRPG